MTRKVILTSLVIGLVSLVASNLKHFGEKVYFDEVDEEGVCEVEDEFYSKNGVELIVDLYSFVVKEMEELLESSDDPLPEWRQRYMLSSLNWAKKGCNLDFIFWKTSKADLNYWRLKAYDILLVLNINKLTIINKQDHHQV